jgi:hypothetical protein
MPPACFRAAAWQRRGGHCLSVRGRSAASHEASKLAATPQLTSQKLPYRPQAKLAERHGRQWRSGEVEQRANPSSLSGMRHLVWHLLRPLPRRAKREVPKCRGRGTRGGNWGFELHDAAQWISSILHSRSTSALWERGCRICTRAYAPRHRSGGASLARRGGWLSSVAAKPPSRREAPLLIHIVANNGQ